MPAPYYFFQHLLNLPARCGGRPLTVAWQIVLVGALAVGGLVSQLQAGEPITVPSMLLTTVESAQVSAAREGILAKVLVQEGQLVKSQQLIAQLESGQAKLAVEEAQLQLQLATQVVEDDVDIRYARKTLEQAENESARSAAVNETLPGTIADRELDFLQLAVDRAQLEIERAQKERHLAATKVRLQEAALRMAELELAEHQFHAPLSGMVVSVTKTAGEWVEPGDPIVRIVRIDRIRAEGLLPADSAHIDLIGRSAELIVEIPGRPTIRVTGKVTFVSPEANPVNAMVRIWAEFNREHAALRPGLRGIVHIAGGPHAD